MLPGLQKLHNESCPHKGRALPCCAVVRIQGSTLCYAGPCSCDALGEQHPFFLHIWEGIRDTVQDQMLRVLREDRALNPGNCSTVGSRRNLSGAGSTVPPNWG